jgi:hypothetical protein
MLFCAGSLAGQTFAVEGDVLNAATGGPVPGAHIALTGHLGSETMGNIACVSDTAGHFHADLPENITSVVVSVGRTGFAGIALAFDRSQPRRPVRVSLVPQGVLSGKVEDQDGFPAEGARVEAMLYNFLRGERKLTTVASSPVNDLGEYRIPLPPGFYYVRAIPSRGAVRWDARNSAEYYRGTLDPLPANRVRIEAGVDQHGIDLHLTRHDGVSISGRLVVTAAVPVDAHSLQLESGSDTLEPTREISLGPDGSFVVHHVASGKWRLSFHQPQGLVQAGDLAVERVFDVGNTDITEVVLSPQALLPRDLPGMLTFAGNIRPHPVAIGLRRNGSGADVSAISNEDGSFILKGLLPGRYRLHVQATITNRQSGVRPGFPVSVQLGDQVALHQDVDIEGTTAGPLRITLTDATTPLSGKLLDKSGQPVAGAAIVLHGDRAFSATTDQDGVFRYPHVYPGDYYLVPRSSSSSSDDTDESATMVHVTEQEGAPVVLTLR